MRAAAGDPAPALIFESRRDCAGAAIEIAPDQGAVGMQARVSPIQPEVRDKPGESEPADPADEFEQPTAGPTRARPSEPEPASAAPPASLQRYVDGAMRIARRSEMRLFQCDVHLEYARLALAEGVKEQARDHVAEARRLADETGYGHRRSEVEALKAEVR